MVTYTCTESLHRPNLSLLSSQIPGAVKLQCYPLPHQAGLCHSKLLCLSVSPLPKAGYSPLIKQAKYVTGILDTCMISSLYHQHYYLALIADLDVQFMFNTFQNSRKMFWEIFCDTRCNNCHFLSPFFNVSQLLCKSKWIFVKIPQKANRLLSVCLPYKCSQQAVSPPVSASFSAAHNMACHKPPSQPFTKSDTAFPSSGAINPKQWVSRPPWDPCPETW